MSTAVVSKEDILKLREKTGAGFMECRDALQETGGDVDRAVQILRRKGIQVAEKKSGREVKEGLVYSYIHPGSRVGVLIEVACETDFVARNSDFQAFVKDVALQVAASRPRYITRQDVPPAVVESEKNIYASQISGKPLAVVEKIVAGKLEKFYQETCLLDQPFIKRPDVNIQAYLVETIARIGENIVIRRFTRYELGEDIRPHVTT
ncbi:MAG: elongation factor Ts [Candidatus Omnitrophica bacterium]|nr:elongation factor Ts [Candidatus Omnitrophota bacterium]